MLKTLQDQAKLKRNLIDIIKNLHYIISDVLVVFTVGFLVWYMFYGERDTQTYVWDCWFLSTRKYFSSLKLTLVSKSS